MKGKRIISLLLAVVLCIGLLPLIARAAYGYTYGVLTYTITNGEVAITDCDESVTSVTIPRKIGGYPVTRIGDCAFSECDKLTSIIIPSSVTSIGAAAFSDCSSLSSVTIPDSVTSIELQAFLCCTSLSSVTIPDSVTSIGSQAFLNCTSLSSVIIPNSVATIESGTFCGCSSLTSVTISKGVKTIGGSAFENCTSLNSVIIPDSVTTIGFAAFYGCSNLKRVYFVGNTPTFETEKKYLWENKGYLSYESWAFRGVTATAYYPSENETWTSDARQGYGGTITWVSYAEGETPWETPTEHTHSYTQNKASGSKASDATCTEPAKYYVQCDNCKHVSDTLTVSVGTANGHSFTNYKSNNDATCTADGTKTAKCDHCTETDTVTDVGSKKNHDFSNNAEYCKLGCGTPNPDYNPCANGHSFTNYKSNNDATCTADGTKTAKCDHCTETDTIDDVGSKKNHDFSDNAEYCKLGCGTPNPDYDPCAGGHHSFTDYKSNNDATCAADGTKTAKCDHCTETDTIDDVGSKKNHDFSDNAEYCKLGCGTPNPDYNPCAGGHSFTNYKSNNDATCTADGTKTAKCDHCTETDTIDDVGSKKNHDFLDNAEYCKLGCGTPNPDYDSGEENQTYSITYDFNDKDITNKTKLQPQNPTSYTSNSETITLNPITAKGAGGKVFYEWRDEDGNPVTEIPTGSTGNITLKAYWKYPVNYHFLDEDGNEISKLTEYFVEDAYADYTLAVAEDRNGCTFDGWYQAKKDIGKESKKTTSIYMAKKFELYGQYVADPTARVLTITYDSFGGEGAPEVQTYTFAEGEEYTLLPISSVIPTREGYKFCGWSRIKPQNPWDADLQAGTNWFVRWANVEAKGGNVTLYAVWEKL